MIFVMCEYKRECLLRQKYLLEKKFIIFENISEVQCISLLITNCVAIWRKKKLKRELKGNYLVRRYLDYFSTEARLKVWGTSFALRLEFISVGWEQTFEWVPNDYQFTVCGQFFLDLGHCEVAKTLKGARGMRQIRWNFQRWASFPFSSCDHQHTFPIRASYLCTKIHLFYWFSLLEYYYRQDAIFLNKFNSITTFIIFNIYYQPSRFMWHVFYQ